MFVLLQAVGFDKKEIPDLARVKVLNSYFMSWDDEFLLIIIVLYCFFSCVDVVSKVELIFANVYWVLLPKLRSLMCES